MHPDGLCTCPICNGDIEWLRQENAKAAAKEETKRLRRNAQARARNQARRDLGLTKTPYGWE